MPRISMDDSPPKSLEERVEKKISKLPKRPHPGAIALFEPCELGYACPICGEHGEPSMKHGRGITWSEYYGFIWCHKCEKDIPSCLCVRYYEEPYRGGKEMTTLDKYVKSTDIFLDTLKGITANNVEPKKEE